MRADEKSLPGPRLVQLEAIRYEIGQLVNEPGWQRYKLDVDYAYHFMAMRLTMERSVWGKAGNDVAEASWPEDWWQHFRQRWAPAWWLRRHPVKRTYRKWTAHTLAPDLHLPAFEGKPVATVAVFEPRHWDTPTL